MRVLTQVGPNTGLRDRSRCHWLTQLRGIQDRLDLGPGHPPTQNHLRHSRRRRSLPQMNAPKRVIVIEVAGWGLAGETTLLLGVLEHIQLEQRIWQRTGGFWSA
jgi:hypothetical protein